MYKIRPYTILMMIKWLEWKVMNVHKFVVDKQYKDHLFLFGSMCHLKEIRLKKNHSPFFLLYWHINSHALMVLANI